MHSLLNVHVSLNIKNNFRESEVLCPSGDYVYWCLGCMNVNGVGDSWDDTTSPIPGLLGAHFCRIYINYN